ncbi:hypothetical protein [Brucella anthropi]|uniref:hypothetical protein n=1 Tax=Brucella anthropi TaxID=529 RepID=UPI0009BBBA27|nr:hypothetical protein [Brucella anthropi]
MDEGAYLAASFTKEKAGCSSRSPSILEIGEALNDPARLTTVCRFTDEMRQRLDHLDRKAGRAALRERE